MDISLFLLQFFGLMYVAIGLAILFNPRDTKAMVDTMTDQERPYRMRVIALLPLAFGLIVVLTHHAWDTVPYAILSAIGWIALLKGAFNLLAPIELAHRVVRFSNRAAFYVYGGLFAVVLGVYLAAAGFGLLT